MQSSVYRLLNTGLWAIEWLSIYLFIVKQTIVVLLWALIVHGGMRERLQQKRNLLTVQALHTK